MDTAVSGQFQMKALPKSPLAPILGGMDSRRHAEWPPVAAGSSGDDGLGDGFRGMRPIMTPQLMMAIRLLHMARAELVVQEEDEEPPSDGTHDVRGGQHPPKRVRDFRSAVPVAK